MHHRWLCGWGMLFLSLVIPARLHAQFQQPTEEELKMTADPKAPGAAAVYLYREEVADDIGSYHSYYERIKILADKGKELATVRIPYDKGEFRVEDIKARTIHSDGTVIPLTVKPEDLVDFKSKDFQLHRIVFTLPDVQVGSIIEYRLKLHYYEDMVFSPHWDLQQEYFVHKAHYLFHPTNRVVSNSAGQMLYTLLWVATSKDLNVRKDKDAYLLDVTDIPPTPNEDWMPPLNTIKLSVDFYYSNVRSGEDFWKAAGKTWAEGLDNFIGSSGALKEAATEMVSPGDSEEQKARKIYAAVMKLDNTDFSREKSETERKRDKLKGIESADDVWKQQSGDGNQIALLYAALARAAGLQVWPMKVVNRNRAMFDQDHLTTDQLDAFIDIVSIGGKEIYIDPGEKMCPFGRLHWHHQIAGGLRTSATGTSLATSPGTTYLGNSTLRTADLGVDDHGNVKGFVRYVMSGTEALYWRQLALENDEAEVKKQFEESLERDMPDGVQATLDHFVGLADYESQLMAVVNVSGVIGAAIGKHMVLPGLFFETRSTHPFVLQEKRITPIDLHYTELLQDDVVYHLPVGFPIEGAPKNDDLKWSDQMALRVSALDKDGSIELKRILARNVVLLAPADYADLHDFYQKLAIVDQQQIVLSRPQATKGN